MGKLLWVIINTKVLRWHMTLSWNQWNVNIASFTKIHVLIEKIFQLHIFCFIHCVFGEQLSNLLLLHWRRAALFLGENFVFFHELCYGAWYYSSISTDVIMRFSDCFSEKGHYLCSFCRRGRFAEGMEILTQIGVHFSGTHPVLFFGIRHLRADFTKDQLGPYMQLGCYLQCLYFQLMPPVYICVETRVLWDRQSQAPLAGRTRLTELLSLQPRHCCWLQL